MKPHRVRMAHNLLVAYGLTDKLDVFTPPRASEKEMTRFHADEYISFLKLVTPDSVNEHQETLSRFNVLEDCPVFDGLWEYCQISAGGSLAGAARLNSGDADVAINWAGGLHHAKKAEASGFCYVNDCVLAILELLKVHSRVLYVDIDIHHGDGVEEAFYSTDRVMTASFHKFGGFFPGTGAVDDIGHGRGKHYAVNFPLRDGIDDESYREIFMPVMSRIMEWYRPGAVVLQCGADSLSGDRLGCFNLSLRGHAQCVDFFKSFDVPLLLLGGGGYTIRNVARCWAYETSRVVGVELPDDLPFNDNLEFYAPEFRLHIVPSNMENHNTPGELERNKSRILEYLRGLPAAPSVPIIDVPRASPLGVHIRDVDSDGDDPDVRHHRQRAKMVVEYEDSDDELAIGGDDILGNIPSARRRLQRPAVTFPSSKQNGAFAPVVSVSRDVHSPPRAIAPRVPPPEPFGFYVPELSGGGSTSKGIRHQVSVLVDPHPKDLKVVRGHSLAVADGDLTSHLPSDKLDVGDKRRRVSATTGVENGEEDDHSQRKDTATSQKKAGKVTSRAEESRAKPSNDNSKTDEPERSRNSSGVHASRVRARTGEKRFEGSFSSKPVAKDGSRRKSSDILKQPKHIRDASGHDDSELGKRGRDGKVLDSSPRNEGQQDLSPLENIAVERELERSKVTSTQDQTGNAREQDSSSVPESNPSTNKKEDVEMRDAPSTVSPVLPPISSHGDGDTKGQTVGKGDVDSRIHKADDSTGPEGNVDERRKRVARLEVDKVEAENEDPASKPSQQGKKGSSILSTRADLKPTEKPLRSSPVVSPKSAVEEKPSSRVPTPQLTKSNQKVSKDKISDGHTPKEDRGRTLHNPSAEEVRDPITRRESDSRHDRWGGTKTSTPESGIVRSGAGKQHSSPFSRWETSQASASGTVRDPKSRGASSLLGQDNVVGQGRGIKNLVASIRWDISRGHQAHASREQESADRGKNKEGVDGGLASPVRKVRSARPWTQGDDSVSGQSGVNPLSAAGRPGRDHGGAWRSPPLAFKVPQSAPQPPVTERAAFGKAVSGTAVTNSHSRGSVSGDATGAASRGSLDILKRREGSDTPVGQRSHLSSGKSPSGGSPVFRSTGIESSEVPERRASTDGNRTSSPVFRGGSHGSAPLRSERPENSSPAATSSVRNKEITGSILESGEKGRSLPRSRAHGKTGDRKEISDEGNHAMEKSARMGKDDDHRGSRSESHDKAANVKSSGHDVPNEKGNTMKEGDTRSERVSSELPGASPVESGSEKRRDGDEQKRTVGKLTIKMSQTGKASAILSKGGEQQAERSFDRDPASTRTKEDDKKNTESSAPTKP